MDSSRALPPVVAGIPGGDRVLEHRYDRYGNRKELTLQDGATATKTFVFADPNNEPWRLPALAGIAAALGFLARRGRPVGR